MVVRRRNPGTARRYAGYVLLVALLVTALANVPAAPASAAGQGGGEIFGSAKRSAAPASPAIAAAVPAGFADTAVWSGLTLPTAIAFAPGGKVFVGEKGGIVKVFDSLSDQHPCTARQTSVRARDETVKASLGSSGFQGWLGQRRGR